MKNIVPDRIKRRAGRPPTGKVNVMISIDPAIKKQLDELARANGLNRSAYLEAVIRMIIVNGFPLP